MKTTALVLASLLVSAIAHTAIAEESAHVAALESPETAGPDVAAGIPVIPATPAAAVEADPSSKDFRIGFWELDLFAVDHEARGTTYRFFDFKIFKLLEVGQGPTYQAFSLFEVPDLLNVFTSRRDGAESETRVMDIQALSLALARQTSESEGSSGTHFLKLPAIGSVAAFETHEEQPTVEEQTYLFLLRRNVPR